LLGLGIQHHDFVPPQRCPHYPVDTLSVWSVELVSSRTDKLVLLDLQADGVSLPVMLFAAWIWVWGTAHSVDLLCGGCGEEQVTLQGTDRDSLDFVRAGVC
jgi:hypothetical protein